MKCKKCHKILERVFEQQQKLCSECGIKKYYQEVQDLTDRNHKKRIKEVYGRIR